MNDGDLDAVFAALSNRTRREIVARLAQGPASVGELAAPFDMSQPAISKHLKMLERAGLVERDVDGVRRPARLNAGPMQDALGWLDAFRAFWPDNFDRLDGLIAELKKEQGDEND